MSKYAAQTSVSSEKSRNEIEATLRRYGASSFGYMTNTDRAVIAFEAAGRRIKFTLPLPDPQAREFTHTAHTDSWRQQQRTAKSATEAWEQACRQRWRALALCVKAKLEAVASGIATFEEEFMAYIVLPNGQTMAEHSLPLIADAYQSGRVPQMLEHF